MSHEAKIGAIIFGGVVAYILIMGGITFMVMLAGSIAEAADDVDEPDPGEPAATEVPA